MSGTVQVPGAGEMEVTSGKVVMTEWHAQGVGMVLSKERLQLLTDRSTDIRTHPRPMTTALGDADG